MSTKDFMLVALWTSLCLATALSDEREQSTRDFVEYVLRIPNSNNVLKSMLTRLQLNKLQEMSPRERAIEEIECLEPSEKHYPLCHQEKKVRRLITNEYEYRPAYYEEVRCASSSGEETDVTNGICSSVGFSCVQWNKTIHLTRRRYSSDCWETRTMVIPAGCECMWPIHRLGDMAMHL